MKTLRSLFLCVVFCTITLSMGANAQSIVQTIPLPSSTYWNQAYGLAADSTALYMTSSSSTSTIPNYGFIYKLDFNGTIIDSIPTGTGQSQGLAHDGTHFYYVRRYTSPSANTIFRMTMSGGIVDSMRFPGTARIFGGAAWDGTHLWVSDYAPTATTGRPAVLLKINWAIKTVVDSIITIGLQPTGIAWDGQYLYYAMDLNSTEPNKNLIYKYDPVLGDTVGTIPLPEPENVDGDPRDMAWDGNYLWVNARRVGGPSTSRTLYKYDLGGGGTPQITVPSNIAFDNTIVGTSNPRALNISNPGTADLIISSFQLGTSIFSISPNTVPDTIGEGQSRNYTVTFSPEAAGDFVDTLKIGSNDPIAPMKNVRLTGRGVLGGASLSVNPTSFNWATRRANSSSGGYFNVTNPGSEPLLINSMTFGGTRFVLDTVGLTFPVQIDTQRTRTFRVWFRPDGAGQFVDTMVIASNAVNTPVLPVPLSGMGDATVTALGAILWEGMVPDNPFTSFDDPQTTSIKQIGDVNNDGVNDVIVASGNYLVTCFNGASSVTGDVLWTFNSGYNNNNTGSVNWEEALQIRDDVDGDGVPDVVFGCGGGNEHVYTVSGRTGNLIWAYGDSVNFSRGDIQGIRVDRDYNGDGVKDVLVSASGTGSGDGGRHAAICLDGLTGAEIFNTTQPSAFTQDIVSTQSGGAIGTSNNGGPYSVNGFTATGLPAWSYGGVSSSTWNMIEVPDINNDGITDIIGLQGFSGGIFAITGDAGAQIWATNLGSSNNGRIVLMDDLNGNGFADFVLSGPTSLYRIDTQTGLSIWSVPLGSSFVRGVDRLSDVNGDGIPDIVIATQQPGKIMVLSGANGATLFEYVFGTAIAQRGDRAAVLASIDGNLSTEFIGGNRQGRVICFSGGPNTTVGVDPVPTLPTEYALAQNYPNPFNPTTTIEIRVPVESPVNLTIYDMLGRTVRSFSFDRISAGTHYIMWDGLNDAGVPVATGVYVYQLRTTGVSLTKRMVLLK